MRCERGVFLAETECGRGKGEGDRLKRGVCTYFAGGDGGRESGDGGWYLVLVTGSFMKEGGRAGKREEMRNG